jgi:hypothetical protein
VRMRCCQRYPEICERFDRFWKGEETDRPVLFISAPKEDPDRSAPAPERGRPEDRILPENMVAAARRRLATTAYAAEGYPHFFVNFGPGILHGCIGGEADFSSWNTTWFPEYLDDIEEFPSLRFEPEGKWWRRIMAATNALLDEVGDELVVSITDIGGCADILASAVGSEQLLYDVVERPEVVKAAVEHCHKLWMEAYEINYAMIAPRQDVSTPWWPILSRGRTYMTQCDFNSMIGPEAFASLFAEELGQIYSGMDEGAYHLDGIGTEVHVPALVALENLRCIQWVPAPGMSPLAHKGMLREIQEAGVAVTFAMSVEEVEAACREFDPRRLMLNVECESEVQARELVENTLRWCEGKG